MSKQEGFNMAEHIKKHGQKGISLNILPKEPEVDHSVPIIPEVNLDDSIIPDEKLLNRDALHKTRRDYNG